jgi:type IV pilus assembly protein PilY1
MAIFGALLALYCSAPLYAFTPADSPLISTGSVTPNLMLLVDDSGSMNNLIRAAAFDQTVARAQIWICTQASSSGCYSTITLDMTNENLFYSSFSRANCAGGYSAFTRSSTNGAQVYCLKVPDPVGSGNTRNSTRYISYLIDQMIAARVTTKDWTDGSIPNDYRINVARNAASALVTANRNLRIGLATFNPPNSRDSGPGGYIAKTISDLTATTSTTTSQANQNYNALQSAISSLGAVANTPLAETYYEITRYMRGMSSYYNSGVSYTSPIQYRCQKNYGVVITDGLPTYDRTFPTNDPLGGTNLPNWDGDSTNDGDNLNGDGEGDTLYLDDIAKFAYDIDMRTTANGTDGAGKSWDAADFPRQYMNTYTVGFTAANDMLGDAAAYGKGKYYQATDAGGLTTALSSALNDITSKAGSGGGGASNSSTLSSTSAYYEAFYDPTDWRGTVKAFGLTSTGAVDTTNVKWSTDTTMAVGTSTPSYQSWNTLTGAAITLAAANFSTAQQAALASNSEGVSANALIEWTKGTANPNLKTRSVLLGDIIDSPLVYASAGDQTTADTASDLSYSVYLASKSAATGMNDSLLVSSNDGMTSVINPTDGTRRYAYLPSSALGNLQLVADPAYINGTSHKFLNDGQITVADAQASGGGWKTIAFAGVGAAGKALFALQLYDATAGNQIKALWEIRAPDTSNSLNPLNDLGYTYAKPEVARLPNGTFAAFVGNGYGSSTGRASLYVINATTGAVINEIVTPMVASGETDNGLSSVRLRLNAQGIVQYAYGGDLKGRMWKFDFVNNTAGAVAFGGTPLFTASGGATQPITAQPTIGNYTSGRKIIFFGTGKLLEAADKTTTSRQAFYGIVDSDSATANYTESQLQAQSILNISGQYVYTSQNDVNYTTQKGFYLPLTYNGSATGERIIYKAFILNGQIYFTTATLDTSDPCSSSGTSKLFALDAATGKALSNYSVFGLGINATNPISGMLLSIGIGNITSLALTGGADSVTGTSAGVLTVQGTNGDSAPFGVDVLVPKRRIMWRQRQ